MWEWGFRIITDAHKHPLVNLQQYLIFLLSSRIHIWKTSLSTECVQRLISLATITLLHVVYKVSELTPHARRALVLCSPDYGCCRNLNSGPWQQRRERKQEQRVPENQAIGSCSQEWRHRLSTLLKPCLDSTKGHFFFQQKDFKWCQIFNLKNHFLFSKSLLPFSAKLDV